MAEEGNYLVPHRRNVSYSATGYRGVDSDRGGKRFRATVGSRKQGTLRRGKYFKSAIEAARQYDEMAKEIYGEDAYLNFPLNGESQNINFKSKSERFSKITTQRCILGHPYIETASFFRGRIICRECNKFSAFRLRERKGKYAFNSGSSEGRS